MATPRAWVAMLPRLRHYSRIDPRCRKGFDIGTQSLDRDHYEVWFECEGCGWQQGRTVVKR